MFMSLLKQLSLSLLLSPLILSCSTPVTGSQGTIRMNLQWPQNFQISAIPENTEYIELEVRGSNTREVQTRLRRTGSESRVQYVLNPGPKTLIAKAFDSDGVLVAEGQTQTEVKAGQSTQAQLEMIPRPQASPSSNPAGNQTGTGGNGSTSPTNSSPEPVASARPSNKPPDPKPSTDPSPNSSPSPQASSSSGGGGGGGRRNDPPVITLFTQDLTVLPGFGAATHLYAEASDPESNLSIPDYSWTCQEVDETDQPFDPIRPCPGSSGFNSLIGPDVYWMGPTTADINPVNGSAYKYYRLTLTVSDGSLNTSQSVKITVPIGTVGSVSVNPGGFNEQ